MKNLRFFFTSLLAFIALSLIGFRSPALAEYTPLIDSTWFDGIKTDVLTASTGILTICLIILGAGLIIKVIMNR